MFLLGVDWPIPAELHILAAAGQTADRLIKPPFRDPLLKATKQIHDKDNTGWGGVEGAVKL